MQKERQLSSTTPLTVIMILIIFVITLVGNIVYHANDHDVTITVTDKERIEADRADHRDPYYLIYGTDDAGETTVLKISDLLLKWKFNSSDLYQQLEVGNTYTVSVSGHRIRLLSAYPNINKIISQDTVSEEINNE